MYCTALYCIPKVSKYLFKTRFTPNPKYKCYVMPLYIEYFHVQIEHIQLMYRMHTCFMYSKYTK